jgi:alpha-L-fucosidase 2
MNKYDSSVILCSTPSSFMGNPFLDGSILGNGQVGVCLPGAIANEQILINHGALRHGGRTGVLQDISDDFRAVRKNFADGKILEAEKVLERALQKKNCRLEAGRPLPLAKIKLDFFNSGVITDYERVTDMRNGEVSVSFTANGKEQTVRRLCISRTTDTVAYNVAKTGGKIRVNISVEPMDKDNKFNTVKYENGYFYLSGRGENGKDYGLVVRAVIVSGAVSVSGTTLTIKDAAELTLFAKPFVNADKDDEFGKIKLELSLIRDNYNKTFAKNCVPFKKAFEETALSLGAAKTSADIKHFVEKTYNNELTAELIERLWNFAKYIAICSSGGYLTPAGLFAADTDCGNGTMSFAAAAWLLYFGITKSVNPDAILNLLDYFIKYESDLKKNAARVYGMRGYFVPNVVCRDSAVFGSVDAGTLHFIASSALAANLFYSYYSVTGEDKILKSKIFPFMREVFAFYSDFLKLDSSGHYMTVPSYSPNSTPGNLIAGKPINNFAFASSSTIDFLAVKSLLLNLIEAASVLKTAEDEITVWRDMLSKLPPLSVNGSGCLKEYSNSVFVDKTENAGVMHGYGLFPLKHFMHGDEQIIYRPNMIQGSTPEAEISASIASANAVKARIDSASNYQPAANLAMAACQMAYAKDASAVYNLLSQIVSTSATPSGLFLSGDWRGSGRTVNGRPDLDISVSLGFGTAITDCIVQSGSRILRVLPVLFDAIMTGEIKNIAADFAASVSVCWDAVRGKLNLKIMPKKSVKIDIVFNDAFRKFRSKDLVWDKSINGLRNVKLTAGKMCSIDIG